MCECGCISVDWRWKIIDHEGSAWLFGVYASCNYCVGPAGVRVFKVPADEFHQWRVDEIPPFDLWRDNIGFIDVVDYQIVRRKVKEAILGFEPDGDAIDDIEADVLAEEAIPDLRDAVFETLREADAR